MARKPIRLSFKIEAYDPATLPMARLAEYMAELAALAGERDSVHFVQIDPGSVQIIHQVEFEAFPKVEARVNAVGLGTAPVGALDAYRAINRKLAEDNTSARYRLADGAESEILYFPGVKTPRRAELLPVEQPGTIDGVVIGVGGRSMTQTTVPVLIDTGDIILTCQASRGTARELGHFLLDAERRFHGQGQWQRDENGAWALKRFLIQSHEELEMMTLGDVVSRLRSIPSDLRPDALADIIRERGDDGDVN